MSFADSTLTFKRAKFVDLISSRPIAKESLHCISLANFHGPIYSQYLKQIALWVEEEWGYLRDFPGVEYRQEFITAHRADFFAVLYGGSLIGTFALLDVEAPLTADRQKEIWCFYVDRNFRNLGIGSGMMHHAKRLAWERGVHMLIFDTLHPSLNRFYLKQGARQICDEARLTVPRYRPEDSSEPVVMLSYPTTPYSISCAPAPDTAPVLGV